MALSKILLVLLFLKGISQTLSVSAVLEDVAVLPCDVSSCLTLYWGKIHPIETPVAECRNQRCIIEEGFRGRFTTSNNYSLLINTVKFNDQGTYECNCDGKRNPVMLQVDVPINATANESENITLPCYADTQIDVNDVTWLYDDQKVLHYMKDGSSIPGRGYESRVTLTEGGFKYGDLSLTITGVQKTDAGLYRCFVHDETAKGYPHAYMLHVNESSNSPGGNQTEINKNEKRIPVGFIISIILFILSLILLAACMITKSPTQESEPVQESDQRPSTLPFNLDTTDQQTPSDTHELMPTSDSELRCTEETC